MQRSLAYVVAIYYLNYQFICCNSRAESSLNGAVLLDWLGAFVCVRICCSCEGSLIFYCLTYFSFGNFLSFDFGVFYFSIL